MKKVILVTGAHRSGSTWVGDILTSREEITYIHEPFNVGIKIYNSPLKYWYEYISNESEESYRKKCEKYVSSFFSVIRFRGLLSAMRVGAPKYNQHIGLDLLSSLKSDYCLIKDPIALMSADWFQKTFQAKVIITIRHPAAFVASLKVKNWRFDFSNFLSQDLLMNRFMNPYHEEMETIVSRDADIVEQGALLWRILHQVIFSYKESKSPDYYFARHEDLSLNPEQEFMDIFAFLGIEMNEQVVEKIKETTTSKTLDVGKRDSRENIKSWKKRLTTEEIEFIKTKCEPEWKLFYSESDWY